ncbi:acyl-CoA reductase [Marinilongibacter aquaticus]|uniref:acyl-CoA reductase n=1 Tax=Marinilongibacter aquaticus TaxID=2975157 RepID=UPI0021BD166F|nr:acyl-CoA reductase [Marinilongibacter aquaticus]UBM59276.1 acyl-CoA reductase [Marinilongibacter aquaticus]
MTRKERIVLLDTFGDFLRDPKNEAELRDWAARAKNENGWFTEDNVLLSLHNIASNYLDKTALEQFSINLKEVEPKKIGIVAAGNIPLVGFHDLICVLLTGHKALLKLSSSDSILMRMVIRKLIEMDSRIEEQIEVVERLNAADAYIATGSDNTARYFEYYFSKKPHIIRKNRSSVAVLTGLESNSDLRNLGNDIFQYFGLGCRNVSKLFVPEDYVFDTFFESIEYWNSIKIHHKYNNNYDYNKSIYLINGDHHFDNGFLMLKEDQALVSPLSVVYYERYQSAEDLEAKLKAQEEKIQCVVGQNFTPFGGSQSPKLNDFADGLNTLDFLNEIGS